MTIHNFDPTYKWLLKYLIEKGYLKESMNNSIVKLQKKEKKYWERTEKEKPKSEYFPSIEEQHIFTFRGVKMFAYQSQAEESVEIGWGKKQFKEEHITIYCKSGQTDLIRDLIDEAVIHSMEQDKGLLGIYQVPKWWTEWQKVMTKQARSLESVVLDTDISETLIKDITTFQ